MLLWFYKISINKHYIHDGHKILSLINLKCTCLKSSHLICIHLLNKVWFIGKLTESQNHLAIQSENHLVNINTWFRIRFCFRPMHRTELYDAMNFLLNGHSATKVVVMLFSPDMISCHDNFQTKPVKILSMYDFLPWQSSNKPIKIQCYQQMK